MDNLLDTGTASIDLNLIMKNAQGILDKTCERYSKRLPKIFAGAPKYFENTRFSIAKNMIFNSSNLLIEKKNQKHHKKHCNIFHPLLYY